MSESHDIEQIARTIYESRNGAGAKPWSIRPKAHKAPYFDDARAILPLIRAAEAKGAQWLDISTAPKDGPQIMLGIVRSGVLEEIHIGGFRWAVNDEEDSCWWSDQADDEIRPTHWQPLPPIKEG